MINLSQFIAGVSKIVQVASNLLEKIFQKMDVNKIGMVDLEKFMALFAAKIGSQIPRVPEIEDNFKWQESIIKQIREWVKESKMSPDEAFKTFDHDFDGLINKADMKQSLIKMLKI